VKQMCVRGLFLAVAASMAVALAGCHGAKHYNAQDPRDVARAFWRAYLNNNHGAIEATLTATARKNIWKNLTLHGGADYPFTVGEPEIKGDSAVVPVTTTVFFMGKTEKGTEKVAMRREGGEWRVWGIVKRARTGTILRSASNKRRPRAR